jgi:NAD(P)H-flavin reductase
MALTEIQLTKKIPLTKDVFELHYDMGKDVQMLPGQFVTFILPQIGGRSYSILEILNNRIIILIIKKWDMENS